MASILRFISVASFLGGLLAALASHPYFLQAIYLLGAGVVSAVTFWWMAGVYENTASSAASLREVSAFLRPKQDHHAAGNQEALPPGVNVRHPSFGNGQVVSPAGDGMALVKFGGGHQVVKQTDLTDL